MTKQEYIQQAYGECWDKVKDYVDEDGWCTMFKDDEKLTPTFKELGFSQEYIGDNIRSGYEYESNTHKWRFNTLNSLENNNGWISIKDRESLPKEVGGLYWVMDKEHDYPLYTHFYNDEEYWLKYYTHYQLIENPKPPLYD